MQGLSFDGWLQVARYFTVTDLCSCMRVSHEWFYVWVSDRMWSHQKNRVCSVYPELASIFELYPGRDDTEARVSKASIKSNSNKKRKTAWIMPKRGGTWCVFSRFISKGFGVDSIKAKLMNDPLLHSIIGAVARSCVPLNHLVVSTEVYDTRDDDTRTMVKVIMKTSMYEIKAYFQQRKDYFRWSVKDLSTNRFRVDHSKWMRYSCNSIVSWKRFILEKPFVRDFFSLGYQFPSDAFFYVMETEEKKKFINAPP